MDFRDQTAVVTGAASGIGRAVALNLAKAGATVVAADRDLDGAKQTAELDSHRRITAYRVDVSEPDAVGELRDEVIDRHGGPQVLVNAAGWDRGGPFIEGDEDFWHNIVEINYLGQVRMARAFIEQMTANNGGRIVNIASDAGRVGSSGETVYAGAKGGVIAFTKSLARESARHGITVNCVCPGPTATPLFDAMPERLRQGLVRAIPMRRVAEPDEVAGAVLYFASDAARYTTGQVLSVSGGLTMAG